jgi:hypothetical protein
LFFCKSSSSSQSTGDLPSLGELPSLGKHSFIARSQAVIYSSQDHSSHNICLSFIIRQPAVSRFGIISAAVCYSKLSKHEISF